MALGSASMRAARLVLLVAFGVVSAGAWPGCGGRPLVPDASVPDSGGVAPEIDAGRALGAVCVDAGDYEWRFRTTFDTSDCASRPVTPCQAVSPLLPQPSALEAATLSLPGPNCSLPVHLEVRVALVYGCPTELEAGGPYGPTLPAYVLDYLNCLADALAKARIACGNTAADCFKEDLETIQ
jgi:hypothetical protein